MIGDTIWITGASSGIGADLALKLAGQHKTVCVTARSHEKLQDLAEKAKGLNGKIVPFPGNVLSLEDMGAIVEKIEKEIGELDLAILNAGTYKPDTAVNFTAENFHNHVSVNLQGTANCLEPVLKRFIERKKGHIALVASVAGYRGLPRSLSYGPTKAALINMAEALAIECLDKGIKVQVINPGFVKTPLTAQNDFEMPFIISSEAAADYICKGLMGNNFEISFPWKMKTLLKLLGKLPDRLYFKAVKNATAGKSEDK